MRRDAWPALIVAAPVVALLTWWTFTGGGYLPTVWYPGALAALGLLAVVVLSGAARWHRRRPWLLALSALAAYTAWSFLSVLWAGSPGDAVQGSHRTLAYLALFAAMALVRWTQTALLVALGAWIAAVAAAAVSTTLQLGGDHALGLVIDARLSDPLGYMNANPALWTMAALPALVIGSRASTPVLARPFLLAAAAMMIQLSVLSQSRGWLFTLPVVVLLALALTPGRLRAAIFALPIAGALALSLPELLEPFDVGGSRDPAAVAGPLRDALGDAASAVWSSTAVALAIAAALVLLDRLAPIPARVRAASVPIGGVLLALVLAGGVAGAVVAADGNPVERIDRAWEDFKDFEDDQQKGQARFSELGSTRYDFWRVGVDLIGERPLIGHGQDNFAEAYVERRRSDYEETRWVHSLWLRLLTHTGVVGLVLFLAALGGIVAAAGVLSRRRPGREVTAIALLPLAYWLVHGSVDWLWEYPALSGAALAFAGAATGLGTRLARRQGETTPPPPPRAVRVGATAGGGLVVAVCALWLATTFLAERNRSLGERGYATDPELALERFERARALNPFDARAALLEGLALARAQRLEDARSAMLEAADRSPDDWLIRFEIGLLPGQPDARAQLQEARRLNPREPLVAEALRRLGTRSPLTPSEAAAAFRERVTRRFGT